MLRGNALAKVDGKGRLKLPAQFRSHLESTYGTDFFITSHSGDSALIYPLPVYAALEQRLSEAPSLAPPIKKLRTALNYYGQSVSMDAQGRILVHPLLRGKAEISGEVSIVGMQNFLEVWNHQQLTQRVEDDPLNDDDMQALSDFGF